jgi:tryptophan synthase alpha chain
MTGEQTVNRIDATFAALRAKGSFAIQPYLTSGFPTPTLWRELVLGLAESASMFEIGMPFSDPLADGVTVQRAYQRALENGITPRACLDLIADVRGQIETPMLLMGYVNPMLRYGLERFVADAKEAGADGLIIPDVPVEESDEIQDLADEAGLRLIHFLAPTSDEKRIARVAERAKGFIYCVSLTGVTGARSELSSVLPDFLARVRAQTDVPLVVGFGISRPEHVQRIAQMADGAIVGGALIDVIERGEKEDGDVVAAARAFIRSLRDAADSSVRPASATQPA